jgi:hypothetical protein
VLKSHQLKNQVDYLEAEESLTKLLVNQALVLVCLGNNNLTQAYLVIPSVPVLLLVVLLGRQFNQQVDHYLELGHSIQVPLGNNNNNKLSHLLVGSVNHNSLQPLVVGFSGRVLLLVGAYSEGVPITHNPHNQHKEHFSQPLMEIKSGFSVHQLHRKRFSLFSSSWILSQFCFLASPRLQQQS